MTEEQLNEMRATITKTLGTSPDAAGQADQIAEALAAAGFVKEDHVEYAADHKHSGTDVVDEDGDLWADRYEFEEYYEEYGSVTLLQRSVGPWVPLETAE